MTVRIPKKRLICLSVVAFVCAFSGRAQQPESKALFPVEMDGKFGFIDRAGRIVIPLQFDSVNDFHDGLALVTASNRKMFIDTSGKIVFNAVYDVVNANHQPQFQAYFDVVSNFSEGLAPVNIGQKRIPNLGLISDPGKWGLYRQDRQPGNPFEAYARRKL